MHACLASSFLLGVWRLGSQLNRLGDPQLNRLGDPSLSIVPLQGMTHAYLIK